MFQASNQLITKFPYLLQPTSPMIEAMIVTNPVTASDLKMSLELLFHVIDAKIAI